MGPIKFPAILVLVLATPAATGDEAGTYQLDNVIYRLPEAWRKGTVGGKVRLSPRSSKAGPCSISIRRGEALVGDLEPWLTRTLAGLVEEKQEVVSTRFTPIRSGSGREVPALLAVQVIDDGRRERLARAAMAFRPKDRAEVLIFEARGPEAVAEHMKTFLGCCEGLRFVNMGAPPLLGEPSPGPLDGAYFGSEVGYGLGGMEFQQEYFVFASSGRFCRGIPEGANLASLDFDDLVGREPDRAGNYRLEGERLILEYADGEKLERSLQRKEGDRSLVISRTTYNRVPPPADGARFEGVFTCFSYTSFTPGSGVVGGVSSERSFRFGADGRFTATRSTGVMASFEDAGGDSRGGLAGSNGNDASGRYRVEGGALELNHEGGGRARLSILQVSDTMLILDGDIYMRKDRKRTSGADR